MFTAVLPTVSVKVLPLRFNVGLPAVLATMEMPLVSVWAASTV